jgi:hypothetical protein
MTQYYKELLLLAFKFYYIDSDMIRQTSSDQKDNLLKHNDPYKIQSLDGDKKTIKKIEIKPRKLN